MPAGEVARGGAEGEGGEDGRPVERLAAAGADAVDGQGPFTRVPEDEDHGQYGKEGRRRHGVRYAEADVQDVGCHGAEHADHDDGGPVGPGDVPAESELHGEGDRQGEAAESDRRNRTEQAGQEVGRRLAHAGGQHLDDPEVDGHLWHLVRHPAYGDEGLVVEDVLCGHDPHVGTPCLNTT